MSEFTVGDEDFLLDGRPVRLLSGALHYFRVHEGQWGHRLAMLRALGLNCVETYVPWNLHEPRPGGDRRAAGIDRPHVGLEGTDAALRFVHGRDAEIPESLHRPLIGTIDVPYGNCLHHTSPAIRVIR